MDSTLTPATGSAWLALLALLALAVSACGGADFPQSTTVPSSSSTTIVAMPGGEGLVAANGEEGTVSFVSTPERRVSILELEGEPSHVMASQDRVWVTLRDAGQLVELHVGPAGLTERARSDIGSEPVGIVASADGESLFVAVSMDHQIAELDPHTLAVRRRIDVPAEVRWLSLHPSGILFAAGPTSAALYVVDVTAHPADVAVWLPKVARTGRQARISGNMDIAPSGQQLAIPLVELDDPTIVDDAYYDTAMVDPVVELIDLNEQTGRPQADHLWLATGGVSPVSSLTWTERHGIVVTMLGEPHIALADPTFATDGQKVPMGHGATGAAGGSDGTVWIHEAFDLTVTSVDDPSSPISIGYSRLSETLRQGRYLFFSATDPQITARGIACATCHVDGRSDNRTWGLTSGRWQTPSLAGGIAATAPVTWAQDVPSVADEAALTSENRMGGDGSADYDALAAYIETIRLPNPPTPTVSEDVLALGRRAFDKAQCSTCHPAPLFTDNQSHPMFGTVAMQTPSLRGLASTAPYYRFGDAPTLEDMLDGADGTMGRVDLLSDEEREALAHYLRSL